MAPGTEDEESDKEESEYNESDSKESKVFILAKMMMRKMVMTTLRTKTLAKRRHPTDFCRLFIIIHSLFYIHLLITLFFLQQLTT